MNRTFQVVAAVVEAVAFIAMVALVVMALSLADVR